MPSLVNLCVTTCGRHSSVVFNSFCQRFARLGLAMFFAIIFTIMCNWKIQLAHSTLWKLWSLCWIMLYRVHSSVLSVKILMVHFFFIDRFFADGSSSSFVLWCWCSCFMAIVVFLPILSSKWYCHSSNVKTENYPVKWDLEPKLF